MRNISIISVLVVFYTIASLALLQTKTSYQAISHYFVAGSLLLGAIALSLRIVLIPVLKVTALFDANFLNIYTFFVVFILGYLRSSGFIMMVTQKLYQDLKAQACMDFLTKLPNRRGIPPYFQDAIEQFQSHCIPFSILLLDIDRFKSINDTYGHDGGDAVLRHLSLELPAILRSPDFLCRWGGEEFLILLPNTPISQARQVAERVRHHVETHSAANGLIPYTISLGVAEFQEYHPNIEALISDADFALYAAKNNGRNRVESAKVKPP
jgi:diguanylate cyclase (GGDEF)-like protein